MHSFIVELLRKWKDKRPEVERNQKILNIPMSNSSFLKVFNKDLEYAGIDKEDDIGRVVHLHALRHSFSSLLARQGVNPHVLQSLARHSPQQTTNSIYTHILRGDDVSAIESLKSPGKVTEKSKNKRIAS